MQLPRPGSGAQGPIVLLDSEEQDELVQPDGCQSPHQQAVQVLDSEDQDNSHLPGEVSWPGPNAMGAGASQAGPEVEGPAAEAADSDRAGCQQEAPHVQQTQTEADFEARIAHLPAKKQRELRGLQRPWHFDAYVPKPTCLMQCHIAQWRSEYT